MRADLLERGRSLSELGSTLRWSDLRAFIRYLPATSHFRRREDPERAVRAELMEVPNQIMMKVHDAVWAAAYAQAGVEGVPPSMLADLLAETSGDQQEAAPRQQKSAAELRAEVAARVRT